MGEGSACQQTRYSDEVGGWRNVAMEVNVRSDSSTNEYPKSAQN
jgi:hypothetical protein